MNRREFTLSLVPAICALGALPSAAQASEEKPHIQVGNIKLIPGLNCNKIDLSSRNYHSKSEDLHGNVLEFKLNETGIFIEIEGISHQLGQELMAEGAAGRVKLIICGTEVPNGPYNFHHYTNEAEFEISYSVRYNPPIDIK